jgi:uncharacterized protein (DUF1778 family)
MAAASRAARTNQQGELVEARSSKSGRVISARGVRPDEMKAARATKTEKLNETRATKTERIAVRLSSRQRRLLQEASKEEGTSLSDFVLKHSTRAAEQLLADRRLFRLSPEDWKAFTTALDRPERDLPKIRALMAERTVLDED